jgi:hypothetical protein
VEHVSVYVDEPVARRTAGKRRTAVYLGLAVLLAAATLVAVNASGSSVRSLSAREAGKAGSVTPQSTGCAVTFTNPGPSAMTACVSGHGNINQIAYSPFGNSSSHISSEGYCLYDLDLGGAYHDTGSVESGWGASAQSSTATTATTTRTTTNGRFTLTQNVFFKYGSRLVLVGNLIKNNDSVSHTVLFSRVFDGDINGTSTGDVYDTAGASVFGQQSDGLALTYLANPGAITQPGVSTFNDWSTTSRFDCQYNTVTTPTAPGDYVGIQEGLFTIGAGATVNFRVGYRLL